MVRKAFSKITHYYVDDNLISDSRNGERRNSTSTLRRRRFSSADSHGKAMSLEPITSVWCLDCRHDIVAIGYSTGKIEVGA